jgi:ubiquinone/menaquinone biosynthesis C-methylase UbiE
MIEQDPNDSFDLKPDFNFDDNGQIIPNDQIIHPNKKLLFETIYKYKPQTVFEIGCGYCNNLLAISQILPSTKLYGCDISHSQYLNGVNKYGSQLQNMNLVISDFLDYQSDIKFDFIFSNAVIMHMATEKAKQTIIKAYDMLSDNGKFLILDKLLLLENHIGFFTETFNNKVIFYTKYAEKYWPDANIEPILLYK